MSVNQRLVNPLTDNLFDIILKLETREECYEFFEDLCTLMNCMICHNGLKWPVCLGMEKNMTRLKKQLEHPRQQSAA